MNCCLLRIHAPFAAVILATMLAGCAGGTFAPTTVTTRAAEAPADDGPPAARTYECDDGSRVHVLTTRDTAQVALGERTLQLARRPADRGRRYGDGPIELRMADEHVHVVSPDGRRECRDAGSAGPWVDAALRGVEIRALGHEPEWALEIAPGSWLRFVPAEEGADVLAPDPVHAIGTDGTRHYTAHSDGREMRVRIREAPCTDSMSGERFALRVVVTLGERTLRGCGRRL